MNIIGGIVVVSGFLICISVPVVKAISRRRRLKNRFEYQPDEWLERFVPQMNDASELDRVLSVLRVVSRSLGVPLGKLRPSDSLKQLYGNDPLSLDGAWADTCQQLTGLAEEIELACDREISENWNTLADVYSTFLNVQAIDGVGVQKE